MKALNGFVLKHRLLRFCPLIIAHFLGSPRFIPNKQHLEKFEKIFFSFSLFGNAFLHAAERTRSRTSHNHFDSSVISVRNEDKNKFIDGLITIMS